MTPRGLLLLFALIAGQTWAQDNPVIDIHGVVTEIGLGLGLAGAEVTLYEFAGPDRERTVFATTATDPKGEFQFHPVRFGDYWIGVKKQAYFASISMDGPQSQKPPSAETGVLVTVSSAHPSQEARLALMRPGELTGTVVDENDKPIAGLLVEITMAGAPGLSKAVTGTSKDGTFSAKALMPGEYLVKISPRQNQLFNALPKFSDDDLKVVDEELQTLYWPGASDVASAAPVRVAPGVPMSLGSIRMRKTPSYRAHVSMANCQPDDLPYFNAATTADGFLALAGGGLPLYLPSNLASCEDFLVQGLKPGPYTFLLSTKSRWAAVPVQVANKNLEVSLTLSGGVDVSGRIVAGDGVTLPALDKVRIMLMAATPGAMNAQTAAPPDAKGAFLAHNVEGPSHRVQISGLSDKYYVKETRLDGQAAPDGVLHLYQGSRIDIVLDDQPATITGSVAEGDKPFSQPLVFVAKSPSLDLAKDRPITGGDDGQFQITGLPPGEYRVLAVPSASLPDGMQISKEMLGRLWSSADKVTVERGGSQTVALKLSDPLR